MNEPFWKAKKLSEMSQAEWESLCDGCGRCCLVKLEDEDTSKIHFTRLACKLLDLGNCRCSDYHNRTKRVNDCVRLTPENVGKLNWLPDSCAYRRLARGQSLAWWHPLVSGRKETVAEAGISVRGHVRSEEGVAEEQVEDHLWKLPRAKKTRT